MGSLIADKQMESACAYTCLKKRKGENNSSNTKAKQAVKAEIICEALGICSRPP